jgi:hypothetical protein
MAGELNYCQAREVLVVGEGYMRGILMLFLGGRCGSLGVMQLLTCRHRCLSALIRSWLT